jgi:hypothetical protein
VRSEADVPAERDRPPQRALALASTSTAFIAAYPPVIGSGSR